MFNIICVKFGQKYNAEFVNKLYSDCNGNCSNNFDFYCYTDDITDIDSSIKIINPIGPTLKGVWNKLTLFNPVANSPGTGSEGNGLYGAINLASIFHSHFMIYPYWEAEFILPSDVSFVTVRLHERNRSTHNGTWNLTSIIYDNNNPYGIFPSNGIKYWFDAKDVKSEDTRWYNKGTAGGYADLSGNGITVTETTGNGLDRIVKAVEGSSTDEIHFNTNEGVNSRDSCNWSRLAFA